MKMFLSFQHIPFPCWNVVMFCSSSRCWVQWCVQFVKYEWLTCKLYIYFLFLYYNKKFKKKAGQTGKFYVYFTIILKVKKHNEILLHSNNNSDSQLDALTFSSVDNTQRVCSIAQSRLSLHNPMDCSPLGSSLHGIFQTRILEWVATSYSRGSSLPRDWTHISCVSCTGRQILYH